MNPVKIPVDYQQVMPYLIIKGATRFIDFMQQVFGAKERMRHMRDEHTIMHAEITVGACVIMLADATGVYETKTGGFFIYVDNADATYTKALNAGAKSIEPICDQPYGRSGGIEDEWGNTWWITSQI